MTSATFLALTLASLAQAEAPGQVVYDAGFYAQFSPRTALDMIRQTPGFTLNEGADRRGFSGAVGNVLVDGSRPIGKSQTLSDVLQRIPAAQVVRIELRRGAETAGDASGQVVVANVVRTPSAGQGAWSLGFELAQQHVPAPNGWLSWSGRIGRTDYSLGANGYSLLRERPGSRTIRDGAGALTGTLRDVSPRAFHEIAVNGEAGRQMPGGRARITGQLAHSRYREESRVIAFSPAGERLDEEFNPYEESRRQFESGLHYEPVLGPWDVTLAALLTRTHFASEARSTRSDGAGRALFAFAQDLARDSGESIVRATVSRDFSPRHRVEAAIEGAINTLDQALVRTLDLGGGPFPLPVPNSNLAVEESRAEAHVVHAWRPADGWTVETRLAAEVSRLSFTGDANQSVPLSYWKPSLQVTRNLGGQNQLRARIYRDVGQLDFTDFVSRASLSDDIIVGGNPDLMPETSWRAELAADLRFGAQGALAVTLFRHWISDTIDLVPAGPPGARFDAPGNIGPGRVIGAQATLRLPLQPIIPGGTFTLDGTWRDARVTDPLTGARRTITDFEETLFKVQFRQDMPVRGLAWGLDYTGKPERVAYRFDEIDRRRESPTLDLWAETNVSSGLKLRLTIVSLLGTPERRERTFFLPDRTGAVDRVERSEQRPGRWLLISMSGNF